MGVSVPEEHSGAIELTETETSNKPNQDILNQNRALMMLMFTLTLMLTLVRQMSI